MLAFAFAQGCYYVYNGTEIPRELTWENLQNHSWMVINKVKHNRQSMIIEDHKYKLQNGDLIRFGRVIFKVSIINKQFKSAKNSSSNNEARNNVKIRKPKNKNESFDSVMPYINLAENKEVHEEHKSHKRFLLKKGGTISEKDNSDSLTENKSFDEDSQWNSQEEILCRIWYGKEEDEDENPLIEPCNWSGSMRYIHYLWAKKWIEDQLTVDIDENVKTYWWERVCWELWNSKFKSLIIKNNKHIKLFEKNKLDDDVYLTLDLVYPDYMKILYWLWISKYDDYKKFRIGRSQASDIKINLDTISRIHAKINYEDDEFFLKDLDSTYGTMVLLKEPLKFTNNKKNETCLVNGSTLIEIKYGEKKKVEETYISKEGEEK